jgi:predicted unusual protein kinase regulating ubiquinone biosynthesis (AarF/ABC1/UbiB family)
MAKREKPIPTGRVRRTAKVAGLAGGQATRAYANRAANVVRSDEKRRAANERFVAQAAEQMVEVLGNMKGAAMKVGQVASFIDTGALPPEARDVVQAKLAELRDSAPRVGFEGMRKVIEQDLEQPLEEVFDEFEEEAVAAASIGQVYRGRLHDGRRVAVKVQYPGVAQAVRADLQNLGLILRAAKRIAPSIDPKALAAEVRERLGEELDYEHEAQTQRAFARTWRGHPFVVVPDVVTRVSRERVLVTEWLEGIGFEQVKRLPDPDRDRFGEIVFRFFSGSMYRTGLFSGDPHPGNYMLLEDGRVGFLDFGMSKQLPPERIEAQVQTFRLALERDAEGLLGKLDDLGFYSADDPEIRPELVLDHFLALSGWIMEDRRFTISQDYVRQVMIDSGDPRSEYWTLMRQGRVPPDAITGMRMEGLQLGVLAQLEATANWHRIAREWLFGDPPCTPLGEEEAPFWARRRPERRVA